MPVNIIFMIPKYIISFNCQNTLTSYQYCKDPFVKKKVFVYIFLICTVLSLLKEFTEKIDDEMKWNSLKSVLSVRTL